MSRKNKNLVRRGSQIDAEQPETVEEHYRKLMADTSIISHQRKVIKPSDFPEWFDEKLFKIGQEYYARNILGMSGAYLAGLFAVLLVPDISDILVATNQSSIPCTAFKRYLETLLHLYNWHTHDYKDANSKFYLSVNTVAWKHRTSSERMMNKVGHGIYQRDMVLTQFGFVGYVMLSPEVMALTNEPREREGFNHFWRVLGKLLGIPDSLNLCRADEAETTMLCQMIRDKVYIPHLLKPNQNFFMLSSAAVDGLQCIDVMLDMDAFYAFFCDINSCENHHENRMGIYSKCNYSYRKFMFSLMKTPVIGSAIRQFWNGYFRACYWVQERWPLVAWLKYGKQQSKINLYPTKTF